MQRKKPEARTKDAGLPIGEKQRAFLYYEKPDDEKVLSLCFISDFRRHKLSLNIRLRGVFTSGFIYTIVFAP